MTEIKATDYARVQRLLRAFRASEGNNPYELPVMSSPPTISVAAAADTTSGLGTAVELVTSNAINPAALARIAFYGGVPKPVANQFVAMPVSSSAPATGTISAFANAYGITADMNQWNSAIEFVTDSDVVEVAAYTNNAKTIMFQVDGRYVDKAGTVGGGASYVPYYYLLTFASRAPRRIRVMTPAINVSQVLMKSVRVKPTASFWKPDQSEVLRLGWAGDSYAEGQPVSALLPNSAWPTLTGELLGMRDVRQLAVGTTGWISTGGGRSKARDQMNFWLTDQAPWDMLVFSYGYNDDGQTAPAVQAEVESCLAAVRAADVNVPVVVFGSQTGNRNNATSTLAVEAGISAAVMAANDTLIKFAPVSSATPPWLFGTGYVGTTNGTGNTDLYISSDHIHPQNPAGHEYLAFRAAAAIRSAVRAMA